MDVDGKDVEEVLEDINDGDDDDGGSDDGDVEVCPAGRATGGGLGLVGALY